MQTIRAAAAQPITEADLDLTRNSLAPEGLNRTMRNAVSVRLTSDVEARLSDLDVMILANGDLYVRSFFFKIVGTFIGDTVTLTRHTIDTDRLRGTVTLDDKVGPASIAGIIQSLAN